MVIVIPIALGTWGVRHAERLVSSGRDARGVVGPSFSTDERATCGSVSSQIVRESDSSCASASDRPRAGQKSRNIFKKYFEHNQPFASRFVGLKFLFASNVFRPP